MPLIFLVNTNGLFPRKTQKELALLMHFKRSYTIQKEKQMECGLIKVLNFVTAL